MEHKERVQVAKHLTKEMVRKYGKDILVGGIFGSTARNEDKKYSDLEMIFIVKDSSKAKTVEFFYKGISMSVDVEKISDVEKSIERIDFTWPLRIARLIDFKVTYGDKKILDNLRKRVQKISDREFETFLRDMIPYTVGIADKIKAAEMEGNRNLAIDLARDVLYGINLSIALLNRRYFTRNFYKNFIEAYKFKKLPRDYKKLVEELWLCRDIDKTVRLTKKLTNNYLELLRKNGIEMKPCTSLEKIRL